MLVMIRENVRTIRLVKLVIVLLLSIFIGLSCLFQTSYNKIKLCGFVGGGYNEVVKDQSKPVYNYFIKNEIVHRHI